MDNDHTLHLEYIAGVPKVVLDGDVLEVGTELMLHRGGERYRAWVVETELDVPPMVRIIDTRWPGAPLNVSVSHLTTIDASAWLALPTPDSEPDPSGG